MGYQEGYGGLDTTSGQQFLGGFVERRTAPTVVSPTILGSPLELAFLQQRRRATDLDVTIAPTRVTGRRQELVPLQQSEPTLKTVSPSIRPIKYKKKEVDPFRGGNKTGELILATNPALDALLDQIHQTRPNWEYLRRKLAEKYPHSNPQSIHGFLAELHINTLLQSLEGSKRERNNLRLIDLNGRETAHYRFSTKNGSLRAISKRTKQDVAEYDAFFEIDGLPTVIEVKARGIQGIEEVDAAIGDEHIRKLFEPLQELYGPHTYFGYALVTVPEQNITSTPIRRTFQEEGGHVTTINTTLIELKKHSRRAVFNLRRAA